MMPLPGSERTRLIRKSRTPWQRGASGGRYEGFPRAGPLWYAEVENLSERRGEDMFTDTIELKDFEKMDPEYQDLLKRILALQADCEIGGPHLYVESILPTAPTKLDQLIVARTAAEEIDHYRKIARLAGEIGADVSYLLSRPHRE